jgi:hypothetical protein
VRAGNPDGHPPIIINDAQAGISAPDPVDKRNRGIYRQSVTGVRITQSQVSV